MLLRPFRLGFYRKVGVLVVANLFRKAREKSMLKEQKKRPVLVDEFISITLKQKPIGAHYLVKFNLFF